MSLHVHVVTDRLTISQRHGLYKTNEGFQLDMDCCTFEMRSPPKVQRLLRTNIYSCGNSLTPHPRMSSFNLSFLLYPSPSSPTMIRHLHVQQRRWPEPRSSSRPACRSVFHLVSFHPPCAHVSPVPTDLPLCKSQVHLSTALSSQSLVLLQGPTHDTGSDCEVTVVAVSFVSRMVFGFAGSQAYEMPAAFHANAIVIEQEEW